MSDPLTPEHRAELAEAEERAKKIRSAGKVASFNVWMLGISAVLSLVFALFSPSALVGAGILAGLTWNEAGGRAALLRFDPEGADRLGRNQLALLAAVVGYCLWSIRVAMTSPMQSEFPELEAMLGDMSELITEITIAVYVSVLLTSLLFQGMTARYYFRRREMIRSYREETPDWILDLQKSTGT